MNRSLLLLLVLVISSCTDTDDRKHFFKSFELTTKAFDILSPNGKPASVERNDEVKALSYYDEAIDESLKVSDEFLISIHPEMPVHYRNEYQQSLMSAADLLRTNTTDINRGIYAARLNETFKSWYVKNAPKEYGGSR